MSLSTGLAQAIGAEPGGVAGLKWSIAAGATGVNVFEDDMPPEPDLAVGVYSTGGFEADSLLPFDAPTVQVVVRGGADPEAARAVWWAIYDFVHALRYTELPNGLFLAYALVVQSGPNRLGTDESGRHRFTMNIRAETRRGSTHRPA